MSWNPNAGISYFEPGCIRCADCGFKPEDPWDDAPEGFDYETFEQWMCEACLTTALEPIPTIYEEDME